MDACIANRSKRSWVAVVALLSACGGTVDSSAPSEVVARIDLSANVLSIAVREESPVSAVFRDATGRQLVSVGTLEWQSSNPAVATVSDGVVRGVSFGGPVTITASLGDVTATVSVTVNPVYKFPASALALGIDSTVALDVALADYFGATISTARPAWSSANTGVARVASDGRITGVATGTTTLNAVYANTQVNVTVEVGTPTLYDGSWSGPWASAVNPNAVNTNRVATIVIAFGEVRSFSMPLRAGTCTASFAAEGHFAITNGQFTVPLPYGSTATGQITGTTAISVALSPIGITSANYVCTGSDQLNINGIAAGVLTLTRS